MRQSLIFLIAVSYVGYSALLLESWCFIGFFGQNCVLKSIILGQNYHGKLNGCVGVNDIIGHFSDDYDFEIYADACYLMPKNSQDDAVIGAEIHLNNFDINSKEFLEQRIIGIRIYSQ